MKRETQQALTDAYNAVQRATQEIMDEITAGLEESHPSGFRQLLREWAKRHEMGDLMKYIDALGEAEKQWKAASEAFRKEAAGV